MNVVDGTKFGCLLAKKWKREALLARSDFGDQQKLLSHEASWPNLQPFALGDFAAAPSIFSFVRNVRIDLPAVSAQAAKLTASIQITARTRLVGRPVAVRARAERSADQIHQ